MIAGHVLLVGAGGLGCPALWGLTHAGVARVTIVDPDVVEVSNLPRQILFGPRDVGQPKAPVAAHAFADADTDVRGVHARLDASTADDLMQDVDVVIDATDGARTKDWLNALAVHRRMPLVHAAGLRSEGRTLWVPAGGRPCLACLFGRLTEDAASCADYGVWNGVVGVIGFRAAAMAAAALRGETPASEYGVFDFASGRTMALGADADPTCSVCAAAHAKAEPYPEALACDTPEATIHTSDVAADVAVDLREVACPLNLLRAKQALAAADVGQLIEFDLGVEGAATVPDGVRLLGHEVVHDEARSDGTRLLRVRVVVRDQGPQLADDALAQFARQIVLPDMQASGQATLMQAHVTLRGSGVALQVAATYLAASGVGALSTSLSEEAAAALRVRTRCLVAGGLPGLAGLTATLGVPADARAALFSADVRDGAVGVYPGRAAAPPALEATQAVAALLADTVQRALVDPTRNDRESLVLR